MWSDFHFIVRHEIVETFPYLYLEKIWLVASVIDRFLFIFKVVLFNCSKSRFFFQFFFLFVLYSIFFFERGSLSPNIVIRSSDHVAEAGTVDVHVPGHGLGHAAVIEIANDPTVAVAAVPVRTARAHAASHTRAANLRTDRRTVVLNQGKRRVFIFTTLFFFLFILHQKIYARFVLRMCTQGLKMMIMWRRHGYRRGNWLVRSLVQLKKQ